MDADGVREIGALLNAYGGIEAMRVAYDLAADWIPWEIRSLQRTWHNVGSWQACCINTWVRLSSWARGGR